MVFPEITCAAPVVVDVAEMPMIDALASTLACGASVANADTVLLEIVLRPEVTEIPRVMEPVDVPAYLLVRLATVFVRKLFVKVELQTIP